MKPYRLEKMAGLIKTAVSEIIQRKIFDPRIKFVCINEVILSKDMKKARIQVSILGDEESKKEAFVALNKATGYIKSELAKRLYIRTLPDIQFCLEDSDFIKEQRSEQI